MTGGENNKISKSGGYLADGGDTRLEYDEAPHAISGAAVRQYGYPEYSNVSDAVTAAISDICERQGGTSRLTILCDWNDDDIDSVVGSCKQLGHDTIFYIHDVDARGAGVTNATEERMKMWLSDRGNTILVTDLPYARGWEDCAMIVLADGFDDNNKCMRAVANLSIVRAKDIRDQSKSVKSDNDTSSDDDNDEFDSDDDIAEFDSDEDDFQSNNDQT